MKIVGINASPRRNKNSGTMLEHALNGALAQGAEVERVDLFDLNFSGCKSCFACKLLGGASFGRCALRDDLTPVLEKVLDADGVVLATPIYFHDVSGAARNFLERLWFPGYLYDKDGKTAYEKRPKMLLIYTMGISKDSYYGQLIERHKKTCEMLFGKTEVLTAVDGYQFDDYSKYSSSMFDPAQKKARFETEFPKECQRAYAMGQELAKQE